MAKSLMATVLLLGQTCALAATVGLSDPTRPPPAFIPKETAPAGAAAPVEAEATALTLQSVMLSPTRKSAIISGESVILGQTIRGARLVEIKETHVVLLGPQGRQKLEITPSVQKAKPGSPLRQTPRNRPRTKQGDIR